MYQEKFTIIMNFKEIIKQEWEKEFPEAAELCTYENSLAIIYELMIEKICVKVWNQALDIALDNVEVICDSSETFQSIDQQSILKLLIDEQGTNTTEV